MDDFFKRPTSCRFPVTPPATGKLALRRVQSCPRNVEKPVSSPIDIPKHTQSYSERKPFKLSISEKSPLSLKVSFSGSC